MAYANFASWQEVRLVHPPLTAASSAYETFPLQIMCLTSTCAFCIDASIRLRVLLQIEFVSSGAAHRDRSLPNQQPLPPLGAHHSSAEPQCATQR